MQLHDPLTVRDMAAAIERIARAIRQREPILIYGDYDVDGTTSVVLLTKAFELAGGIVTYHVPHRLRDGYGMRSEVVEEAAARASSLWSAWIPASAPPKWSGARANWGST